MTILDANGNTIEKPTGFPPSAWTAQTPFGMPYAEYFKLKAGLHRKVSKVRARIKRIAKNGRNTEQKYSYAEAADIFDEVRAIMDEEQLGYDSDLISETIFKHEGGRAPISKVEMLFTWIDLETGYHEFNTWVGTGQDYGDKGIYKSYTGTTKYALVNKLLIPTGDDPSPASGDPEKDATPVQEPQQGRQTNTNAGKSNRSNAAQNKGNSSSRKQNSNKPAERQPGPSNEEPKKEPVMKGIDESDVPASDEKIAAFIERCTEYLVLCENESSDAMNTIMQSMVNNAKWPEIVHVNPEDFNLAEWKQATKVIEDWIIRKKKEKQENE